MEGETNLHVSTHTHSNHTSEFTTKVGSGGGGGLPPPGGGGGSATLSEGSTSAMTDVTFSITSKEVYTGAATTYHDSEQFESEIITEGESLTLGGIYSSFNYEESGGQSDSKTVGNTTTETSSSFSTDLSSQTSVDLTQTDLTYSQWKLTKGGKTLGHAYINSDSETVLEYESEFSYSSQDSFSSETSSTGFDSSTENETKVSVTSTSKVESKHTTDDFHKLTRELVEGEVVETRIDDVSGDFATEAIMISISETETNSESHMNLVPHTLPGGPTSITTLNANNTSSSHSKSVTTTIAEQSGSYSDGESDTSSSKLSTHSVDEFFSLTEGDSYWESLGMVQTIDYTAQEESSSETTFSMEESFNSKGDSAKWSSSIEYERTWSVDADIVGIGAVAILEDSGSESFSESSGDQTYTPRKEDDPNSNYGGRTSPFGENGGNNEGEGGENQTNSGPMFKVGDGIPRNILDTMVASGLAKRDELSSYVGFMTVEEGRYVFYLAKLVPIYERKEIGRRDVGGIHFDKTEPVYGDVPTGEYAYVIVRRIPMGGKNSKSAVDKEGIDIEKVRDKWTREQVKNILWQRSNDHNIEGHEEFISWSKVVPFVGAGDAFFLDPDGNPLEGAIYLAGDLAMLATFAPIVLRLEGRAVVIALRTGAAAGAAGTALNGGASVYYYTINDPETGQTYLVRAIITAAGTVLDVIPLVSNGASKGMAGVLDDSANFAQKKFRETFSDGGKFAGMTIDEVADALELVSKPSQADEDAGEVDNALVD